MLRAYTLNTSFLLLSYITSFPMTPGMEPSVSLLEVCDLRILMQSHVEDSRATVRHRGRCMDLAKYVP